LRSGTSVGANLEEAQAGQSRADFLSKCSIACKEAREAHYWLRLLAEAGVVKPERVAPVLNECNQLIVILTTIVKKVRQNAK
jgi:four helix bundle protein